MKLSLRNIGKLREADVEISGITVIAGENNTGKSTVGKALFSVFNGFYDVKRRIKEEKARAVARILFKGNDDPSLIFKIAKGEPFGQELAEFVIEKVGNPASPEETLSRLRDAISQQDSDIEIRDPSESDANRLFEVLNVADGEIFQELLEERILQEFNGQPNNIYSGSSGEVILTIKQESVTTRFSGNSLQEISSMLDLQTTAVYIDDPFVVDELDLPYGKRRSSMQLFGTSYDHRNHLKNSLLREGYEPNIITKIITNKKFDEIFAKIGLNHESPTIPFEANNRVRNKEEKKLNIRNLSTGMKTFWIIKTLLMNETIQQNGTIILDEPEIHLHPEWQLIFAELIVLLQKEFEMHILLNTHSPYFLEAIEVYSDFHGVADKCKYYLAENIDENNSVITDTTDNTEPIYKKLARPFQELENVRYSHD